METDTEDELDLDEETSLEDLPLGPAGRGIRDETPDEPHQIGESSFHIGCVLEEHGFALLDPEDYHGKYGVTVQWTDPEQYAAADGQVAVIWRVPEPGRIDPLAGPLRRYNVLHRSSADRTRQIICDILNSDQYGVSYSASPDPENPSVILVTVH